MNADIGRKTDGYSCNLICTGFLIPPAFLFAYSISLALSSAKFLILRFVEANFEACLMQGVVFMFVPYLVFELGGFVML